METTSHLALPYLMPSQAQKHVTHNEALRMLDALVQLSVADRSRRVPPSAPAEGDRHIVGSSGEGPWEGKDGQVAAWQGGAWAYFQPAEGWRAWVQEEQSLLLFRDGQWGPLAGEFQNLAMVGINATADPVNRLTVASDAVLLNHGGGGHQLKINKAGPGDTAGLLFQTGFSGRAEMGTAGDDNFHVKVSKDGSTWHEAILIDSETGAVSLPSTSARRREILLADRTYYVRTDGDDGNDGLTDSAGGAFRTVQRALDTTYGTIDLGGRHVTIKLGDGTYPQSLSVGSPQVGAGSVTIKGNPSDPALTVLQRVAPENRLLGVSNSAVLRLAFVTLQSTVITLLATTLGTIYVDAGVRFAGNAGANDAQILAQVGGMVIVSASSYSVAGNAGYHWRALLGGQISASGATVDVTGRTFTTAFAQGERLGMVSCLGASFAGAATGKRYAAILNGLVFTGSGNANFLPGDTMGTTATGGQYT